MDYFATVGLASARKDDHCTVGKFKEVPACFQSPEEYIEIFRPLVLEEFKAQLQSSFLEMPSWEVMYFGVLSVLSVERIDDFHLVHFSHDDNGSTSLKSFAENDLVLLTKNPCKNHLMIFTWLERYSSSITLCAFFFLTTSCPSLLLFSVFLPFIEGCCCCWFFSPLLK